MSIVQPDTDDKTDQRAADPEGSGTHLVCDCQVDATPRLALCGSDCTGGQELEVIETYCVVCWHMAHVARLIGCERCRDDKWAAIL